jgi:hypothetical protein
MPLSAIKGVKAAKCFPAFFPPLRRGKPVNGVKFVQTVEAVPKLQFWNSFLPLEKIA